MYDFTPEQAELAGRNVVLEPRILQVDRILLDPSHPEIADNGGPPPSLKDAPRQEIQEALLEQLLQRHAQQVGFLKQSIRERGFIPAEFVVAKPHPTASGKFLLIVGNLRVAALKELLRYEPFTPETKKLHEELNQIPVRIYHSVGDEAVDTFNESCLQTTRHIANPIDCEEYGKAEVIAFLRDVQGLSYDQIDDKTGIGTVTVGRYYRAFKGLEQMREDRVYGKYASPHIFELFEEAMHKPVVRKWLKWSPSKHRFRNEEKLRHFYHLMAGDPDEGVEPYITSSRQLALFIDLLETENPEPIIDRVIDGEIDIEGAYEQICLKRGAPFRYFEA